MARGVRAYGGGWACPAVMDEGLAMTNELRLLQAVVRILVRQARWIDQVLSAALERSKHLEKSPDPDRAPDGRTIIYRCRWCHAFTAAPSSDRCACGREFYPVAYLVTPGSRFAVADDSESGFKSVDGEPGTLHGLTKMVT